MLELSKNILYKVSFDKKLFRKELVKAIKWINKDEIVLLRAWSIATFGHLYGDVIKEVFDRTMYSV
jgi:hypothetical protein